VDLNKISNYFQKKIQNKIIDIEKYLDEQIKQYNPIIYNSIDLRNSGFKIAPVDVNFFPAGFNNISEQSKKSAVIEIQKLLENQNKILIIAENHDRNINYLKNILSLKQILEEANKEVKIANLVNQEKKSFEIDSSILEIDGLMVSYSETNVKQLKTISDNFIPDRIIINNDMTDGYPDIFDSISNEIFMPNPLCGWFNRKKSTFFQVYNETMTEIGEKFQFDPWVFSPLSTEVDNIDIKNNNDLLKIQNSVRGMMNEAQKKYDHYEIRWTKPYCFVKSNQGTYGMGVISVESSEEIMHLNKKSRHDMETGKSGKKIDSVIIQEGIPTIEKLESATAEKTIYLVNGKIIGGFFRCNQGKNSKINLNSKSSFFKPLNQEDYQTPIIDFIMKVTYLSALKECEYYKELDKSKLFNNAVFNDAITSEQNTSHSPHP
jgi:glutamate--cysteine ligase